MSGLVLKASLVDTEGVDVSGHTNITTGFTEIGDGFYLWYYESFPDDFRGAARFCTTTDSAPLTILAINPEDSESIASILAKVNQILAAGSRNISMQIGLRDRQINVTHGNAAGVNDITIHTGVRNSVSGVNSLTTGIL